MKIGVLIENKILEVINNHLIYNYLVLFIIK